jgi:hypothetical protein
LPFFLLKTTRWKTPGPLRPASFGGRGAALDPALHGGWDGPKTANETGQARCYYRDGTTNMI